MTHFARMKVWLYVVKIIQPNLIPNPALFVFCLFAP